MSCTPIVNAVLLEEFLSLWHALDSSIDLSACGGAEGLLTKLFTELASLFDWQGPAGGFPASVDTLAVCMPSAAQVRSMLPFRCVH
jgi:hypothetical protein